MNKLTAFLRYVNSCPLPITLKHYHIFDPSLLKDGELNSVESWDALRESDEHFSIPHDREKWIEAAEGRLSKDGQDKGLPERAAAVVRCLDRLDAAAIFSAGVGGAGLEYLIKKARPGIRMTCSEYSQASVDALREVFRECDSIVPFDIVRGDWRTTLTVSDLGRTLHVLYRVDPHFTDSEWKMIFTQMHDAGVQHVLIILCCCFTARGLANRMVQRVRWIASGQSMAFAGYIRTEARVREFWDGLYDAERDVFAGLPGYLLSRRPDRK